MVCHNIVMLVGDTSPRTQSSEPKLRRGSPPDQFAPLLDNLNGVAVTDLRGWFEG